MGVFSKLIRRFGRDEGGVFAVIFGLMAIVLVAVGGAVVDYVSLEQTRNRAQIALDAAALALQPDIYVTSITQETIRRQAENLVINRVGDPNITVRVDRISIDRENGRLTLGGEFTIRTAFVQLVGVNTLSAGFTSEAVRGAVNMEISVALDVTGSMSGQRIEDLKDSVDELIDAIVLDDQDQVYTKMALVPYSQAVNAGTYAAALRGPVRQPKNITGVAWASTTIRTITAATRASTVTITSNGHGFNNGEWVYIWDVVGMTQLNNRAYQVTNKQTNTFQLVGVDSRNFSAYSRNGQVRKCNSANCDITVTSNNHGYSTGQYLYVTDVGGLSGINNTTYRVNSTTTNTVVLAGPPNPGTGTYTANTGKLHCTWQTTAEGCTYYYFQSPSGNWNTFPITNCVTERSPNGATDVAPTVTFVGRNYPPSGNGCLNQPIVPLTSNKTTLHNAVAGLTDAGSTSGSLGVLWSWYMLAPNFGYVWPFDSRPAPYRDPRLLKAAIIMTDGEFNTVHCNGAVASNTGTGSGNTTDKINCAAPNGDPYPQARAYCDAMKAKGIEVYTVGFDLGTGTPAAQIMTYCASSAEKAFLAEDGDDLRDAFRQIARNISLLRIAR